MSRRNRYKKIRKKSIFSIFITGILFLAFFWILQNQSYIFDSVKTWAFLNVNNSSNNTIQGDDINTEVHFIDVGQGDATLIICDGETALIDGGNNNKGQFLVDYIKNLKIKRIDYIFATHPDADHIGGLDIVIDNFDIGKVIMPKVEDKLVPTTNTYKDLLLSVFNKQLKITPAKLGQVYNIGDGTIEILSPSKNFSSLNDMSIVAIFEYRDKKFLFTGDIEKDAEDFLISSNKRISADVLKVAHHGASTSTKPEFYNRVNPNYCIISVGDGNKYGHPTQKTLETININKAKVYRTDYQGHIIFNVNDEISVTTKKS